MRICFGALLLWSTLVASAAAQDACTEGRVINEGTAGRCCWPGQTWDEAHHRCSGAPTCPAELVAHGDGCVARVDECVDEEPPAFAGADEALGVERNASAGLGGPQTPGFEPVEPPPTGPVRSRSYAYPDRIPNARQVVTDITGLWVAGVITFGVAYAFGVVMGMFSYNSCCGDSQGWVSWIPVVGAFLQPAVDETSWPGEWFGIPSGFVQAGGVVMMLVGLLTRRTVTVTGYEQTSSAPRLEAGPGQAGASLVWDF